MGVRSQGGAAPCHPHQGRPRRILPGHDGLWGGCHIPHWRSMHAWHGNTVAVLGEESLNKALI